MRPNLLVLLISVFVVFGISILIAATSGFQEAFLISTGILCLLISLLDLVIGLILLLAKKQPWGLAFLLSSGLLLLLGGGICGTMLLFSI